MAARKPSKTLSVTWKAQTTKRYHSHLFAQQRHSAPLRLYGARSPNHENASASASADRHSAPNMIRVRGLATAFATSTSSTNTSVRRSRWRSYLQDILATIPPRLRRRSFFAGAACWKSGGKPPVLDRLNRSRLVGFAGYAVQPMRSHATVKTQWRPGGGGKTSGACGVQIKNGAQLEDPRRLQARAVHRGAGP